MVLPRYAACMKALFPLDGTAESLETLDSGLRLLGQTPLEVTLLVVQQTGFEDAPEDMVHEMDEDEEDEVFPTAASAQRVLDKASKRCQEQGHQAHTKRVEGRVLDCILEEATGHDVLVMAGLHRSGMREKMDFSRKEKIARRAQCNVLLVRR